MLYLQADHLFYEKYGTEESCIEVMTRHVQRVNSIYKNTGMLLNVEENVPTLFILPEWDQKVPLLLQSKQGLMNLVQNKFNNYKIKNLGWRKKSSVDCNQPQLLNRSS
jgi:hypothetical protein